MVPTKRNHALIYRNVPTFLRELREKAGLTQRELADRIGESQWWVHRGEIGSRRVDVAEFIEWCRGCGVEPGETLRQLTKAHRP
jgi:transcriptional regulator with XRE-family HTH domain